MKLLVMGGNGMLGHYFLQKLPERHEVHALFRQPRSAYPWIDGNEGWQCIDGVDVLDSPRLEAVLRALRPDAVINATGLTKQRVQAGFTPAAIRLNALFPHQLAELCAEIGARLILFSTDCVFDGASGFYTETDPTNATDVYGKTKALGEIDDAPHVITLRKSTIGLEIDSAHGLVEWFLAQATPIRGFDRAIYSGLISAELVRVVESILVDHPEMSGLWHVGSEPISKYALLSQLKAALGGRAPLINKDTSVSIDRSLDSTRFQRATGYTPPSWEYMIAELAEEIRARTKMKED